MRSLSIQRLITVGMIGLVVAACGTDDPQPMDDFPEVTPPATEEAPPAMAPGIEQPASANIIALGGSGITGSVELEPVGVGAQVSVTLHGTAAGVHQGHIHTGTCAQPGGVVVPLEPVTMDADGHGEATSTVDLPLSTLRDGQHIVVYHEAGASPGAPVACAEIPAT